MEHYQGGLYSVTAEEIVDGYIQNGCQPLEPFVYLTQGDEVADICWQFLRYDRYSAEEFVEKVNDDEGDDGLLQNEVDRERLVELMEEAESLLGSKMSEKG